MITVSKSRYWLGLFFVVAIVGRSEATEGLIPYLPGVTTGIPVGALPPPRRVCDQQ